MILAHAVRRRHYRVPGKRILVREMFAPDLGAYMKLLGQLSEVPSSALAQERWPKMYQRLMECNNIVPFLAEWRGKVIGCGTLLLEAKLSHGGKRVAHIEDLVVDEKHRGAGVGEVLVKHLVETAQSHGCRKVSLSCAKKNVDFYQHCGFRQSEVTMRLDLPSE